MLIPYTKKAKRNKVGICNICKQKKALSWDHVPPKGGIELTPVERITIRERLNASIEEKEYTVFQNGVKFRTICSSCNAKLGKTYDPVLNDFALGVGKILKSFIEVPPVIHYRTQPIQLIRAILGHFLSAKIVIDNTKIDQTIRNILFEEKNKIPEEIKIFYWVYPYSEIIVIRDVVMPAIRGNFSQFGSFWGILKYFPIAYLLCNLEHYESLNELTIYRDLSLGEFVDIPIHLDKIQHPMWPEMVDEENFMAFGLNMESSVYARPKQS